MGPRSGGVMYQTIASLWALATFAFKTVCQKPCHISAHVIQRRRQMIQCVVTREQGWLFFSPEVISLYEQINQLLPETKKKGAKFFCNHKIYAPLWLSTPGPLKSVCSADISTVNIKQQLFLLAFSFYSEGLISVSLYFSLKKNFWEWCVCACARAHENMTGKCKKQLWKLLLEPFIWAERVKYKHNKHDSQRGKKKKEVSKQVILCFLPYNVKLN